jgi:hypothetical protein
VAGFRGGLPGSLREADGGGEDPEREKKNFFACDAER